MTQKPEAHTNPATTQDSPVVTKSAQDARQGRAGKRVLTVLVVSLLLALMAFVLIGAFSEDLIIGAL